MNCVLCVWGVDDTLFWGRQDGFVGWFEKKVKEQFEVSVVHYIRF